MLKHVWDSDIPPVLREPALFDENGLPRYWATVWSMYQASDLALSSKRKQMGYVEALYRFSERLNGPTVLDDALWRVDIEILSGVLEAYFISIRNQPTVNESAQLRWQTAFRFVSDIILRLSKSNLPISQLEVIKGRLDRLETLYSQLRIVGCCRF